MTDDPLAFRKKMLDWYDANSRDLPWRARANEVPKPYHVWLSEVMLQQTTVQAVIPYFFKFIERWPDIHALAAAENDDVMGAWAGLGYYSRARNLHQCAQVISNDYFGVFPSDIGGLKSLPGVGDYTAAAIRSIAFDFPAVVVDGNVDRVMARYHAIETAFPKGKADVKRYAALFSDGFEHRPGDYAQSLMDLGAGVCKPKTPSCSLCPINQYCKAYDLGAAESYPKKAPKKSRPHKYGYVYWVTNQQGAVLIEKRPDKGLLAGMHGLPTSDGVEDKTALVHLDFECIKPFGGKVTHVFTHFSLELEIFHVSLEDGYVLPANSTFFFLPYSDLSSGGFPTLFKKAIRLF